GGQRGALARLRLRARARVRDAAGGRRRDRHRPAGDAVRGSALDSGGHPVSAPATRGRTVSRGLPFELFLGLRYLRATGQRANLSLFVWIGVGGGFVRGVDLATPAVVVDLRAQLRSGSLEPLTGGQPAVLLGVELARTLGVVVGDAVTAISPKGAMTAVGMVPKMRRFVVAGTIE